ncbi:MAG: prepilin peptidase [Candidatus Bathyarchaeota archaeon]|nr:prepilin peptidase [Candidatus Bathyarchaeota archaeon]
MLLIAAIRISISLIFFIYSAWIDYRTREVSNRVWVLYAPPAFTLTFTELFFYSPGLLPFYGLCFLLTSVIAITLFYVGAFGGADAKALICLALALPFHPQNFVTPLFNDSPLMHFFFPLTVFSNSVFLAALSTLYMSFRNLIWRLEKGKPLFEVGFKRASAARKLAVFLTGCRTPVWRLKEKWHIYPMEDIEKGEDGEIKRKLVLFPRDDGREAVVDRLLMAVEAGEIDEFVWATPGLPMLVFVTIGLVIAIFIGDITWSAVRIFIGG